MPASFVVLEPSKFVRRGAKRVVAAPDDRILERGNLMLADELAPVLEQRCVPPVAAVVNDGHERLAGHVAAEDEDLGLVVGTRVQELAPARLGAVDIGRKEKPHPRVN